MRDIYQAVADKILAALDSGTVPWRKTWQGAANETPRNLSTGKPYRGVNVWLLLLADMPSPYWLTFQQALGLGGCVRKGSKGTPVVFWGTREVEKDGVIEERWFLKTYTVFNASQCDLPADVLPGEIAPRSNDPIESAQFIADQYVYREKLQVTHEGSRAFYRPVTDSVTMPPMSAFDSSTAYYATLFHELSHSTGHPSRLGRLKVDSAVAAFGTEEYSREELVAEFGAAFLCSAAGIANEAEIKNSAAYIASWRRFIKDDPRAVVVAAASAQRAADCILGIDFGDPS